MWSKKRKFILVPLMVAVLLVGSITGTALADASNGNNGTGNRTTFLEMVANELGITVEQLQDAFQQARDTLKETDPEDREPGDFKEMVEDILISEYGILEGDLQAAIDTAREAMQEGLEARMEELKTRLQIRMGELQDKLEARRAELQTRLEARIENMPEELGEKLRERLENRMGELQGKLEARRAELQTKLENRLGNLQDRLEHKAGFSGQGTGNGQGGGNGQGD